MADDDTRFLSNVQRSIVSWVIKHREISYFSQHREDIPPALRPRLKDKDLDLEQVTEIRASGIEITMVLKSNYYDELFSDKSDALHFLYSPWSFVRQGEPSNMELSIRHESMHNFLDGAPDVGRFDRKLFSHEAQAGSTDRSAAETTIRPDQLQAYLAKVNVNQFIDGFQHELLAGMEHAERETFPESPPQDEKYQ